MPTRDWSGFTDKEKTTLLNAGFKEARSRSQDLHGYSKQFDRVHMMTSVKSTEGVRSITVEVTYSYEELRPRPTFCAAGWDEYGETFETSRTLILRDGDDLLIMVREAFNQALQDIVNGLRAVAHDVGEHRRLSMSEEKDA